MVECGVVLDGKYRIEGVLKRGGMGVVVEAWHLRLEQRVAIKVLLPSRVNSEEARLRFEREAQAAYRLKSEHAVTVHDVGMLPSGAPYMVMELLEGEDLRDLICNRGPLPVQEAVDYVLQACEAVAEAHANEIVHRDLKPENLFMSRRLDGEAHIKVLDFGISKVGWSRQNGEPERCLTNDGIVGSPLYMAPEQWVSSRDVGPAADQWALSAILYELLTGVTPFQAPQPMELYGKVLNDRPRNLAELCPQVPGGLRDIVHQGLSKLPARRFPSLAEFALKLAEFGSPESSSRVRQAVALLGFMGKTPKSVRPWRDDPLAADRIDNATTIAATGFETIPDHEFKQRSDGPVSRFTEIRGSTEAGVPSDVHPCLPRPLGDDLNRARQAPASSQLPTGVGPRLRPQLTLARVLLLVVVTTAAATLWRGRAVGRDAVSHRLSVQGQNETATVTPGQGRSRIYDRTSTVTRGKEPAPIAVSAPTATTAKGAGYSVARTSSRRRPLSRKSVSTKQPVVASSPPHSATSSPKVPAEPVATEPPADTASPKLSGSAPPSLSVLDDYVTE